jgi:uncharacterized membrane protein
MSTLWILTLATSASCYLLKILGYSLPESVLNNNRLQRINTYIPIVLLSSLISIQTLTLNREILVDHRLAGVCAAAFALKYRAPFPLMMIIAAGISALTYRLSS